MSTTSYRNRKQGGGRMNFNSKSSGKVQPNRGRSKGRKGRRGRGRGRSRNRGRSYEFNENDFSNTGNAPKKGFINDYSDTGCYVDPNQFQGRSQSNRNERKFQNRRTNQRGYDEEQVFNPGNTSKNGFINDFSDTGSYVNPDQPRKNNQRKSNDRSSENQQRRNQRGAERRHNEQRQLNEGVAKKGFNNFYSDTGSYVDPAELAKFQRKSKERLSKNRKRRNQKGKNNERQYHNRNVSKKGFADDYSEKGYYVQSYGRQPEDNVQRNDHDGKKFQGGDVKTARENKKRQRQMTPSPKLEEKMKKLMETAANVEGRVIIDEMKREMAIAEKLENTWEKERLLAEIQKLEGKGHIHGSCNSVDDNDMERKKKRKKRKKRKGKRARMKEKERMLWESRKREIERKQIGQFFENAQSSNIEKESERRLKEALEREKEENLLREEARKKLEESRAKFAEEQKKREEEERLLLEAREKKLFLDRIREENFQRKCLEKEEAREKKLFLDRIREENLQRKRLEEEAIKKKCYEIEQIELQYRREEEMSRIRKEEKIRRLKSQMPSRGLPYYSKPSQPTWDKHNGKVDRNVGVSDYYPQSGVQYESYNDSQPKLYSRYSHDSHGNVVSDQSGVSNAYPEPYNQHVPTQYYDSSYANQYHQYDGYGVENGTNAIPAHRNQYDIIGNPFNPSDPRLLTSANSQYNQSCQPEQNVQSEAEFLKNLFAAKNESYEVNNSIPQVVSQKQTEKTGELNNNKLNEKNISLGAKSQKDEKKVTEPTESETKVIEKEHVKVVVSQPVEKKRTTAKESKLEKPKERKFTEGKKTKSHVRDNLRHPNLKKEANVKGKRKKSKKKKKKAFTPRNAPKDVVATKHDSEPPKTKRKKKKKKRGKEMNLTAVNAANQSETLKVNGEKTKKTMKEINHKNVMASRERVAKMVKIPLQKRKDKDEERLKKFKATLEKEKRNNLNKQNDFHEKREEKVDNSLKFPPRWASIIDSDRMTAKKNLDDFLENMETEKSMDRVKKGIRLLEETRMNKEKEVAEMEKIWNRTPEEKEELEEEREREKRLRKRKEKLAKKKKKKEEKAMRMEAKRAEKEEQRMKEVKQAEYQEQLRRQEEMKRKDIEREKRREEDIKKEKRRLQKEKREQAKLQEIASIRQKEREEKRKRKQLLKIEKEKKKKRMQEEKAARLKELEDSKLNNIVEDESEEYSDDMDDDDDDDEIPGLEQLEGEVTHTYRQYDASEFTKAEEILEHKKMTKTPKLSTWEKNRKKILSEEKKRTGSKKGKKKKNRRFFCEICSEYHVGESNELQQETCAKLVLGKKLIDEGKAKEAYDLLKEEVLGAVPFDAPMRRISILETLARVCFLLQTRKHTKYLKEGLSYVKELGKKEKFIKKSSKRIASTYILLGEFHLKMYHYESDLKKRKRSLEEAEGAFGIASYHDHNNKTIEEKLSGIGIEKNYSSSKTYYSVLGVPFTATKKDIKDGYREKSLLHHPDRVSDQSNKKAVDEASEKFKEISQAFFVLSNEEKKIAYDRQLRRNKVQDFSFNEQDYDREEEESFDVRDFFNRSYGSRSRNNRSRGRNNGDPFDDLKARFIFEQMFGSLFGDSEECDCAQCRRENRRGRRNGRRRNRF